MRKAQTLIGQDVVSLADGTRITTVKDLVMGDDLTTLAALLVDEGGFLRSSKVIPIHAVSSFGKDAVMVESADALVEASQLPDIDDILRQDLRLVGTQVMTAEGEIKGTISDLYFEPGTGRIAGFEISHGALGDVAQGPSFVQAGDLTGIGSEVAYITADAAAQLDRTDGGAGGAVGQLQEKLGEAGQAAKQQLDAAVADARDRIPTSSQVEGDELVNRRSGTDVTDEHGNVIVATGQLITREHVEQARATGNLEVLRDAADVGGIVERDRAMDLAVEKTRDTAASLWDQFTRKLTEIVDENGRQLDAAQTRRRLTEIADAIGRPVTKVVLDRSDNVVLDYGDILTHEAVQRAWDSGQLDSVLTSIYRTEPALDAGNLRTGIAGQARVEKAAGDAPFIADMEQKLDSMASERESARTQQREQQEAEYRKREEEREERRTQREREEEERREADLATAASGTRQGVGGDSGSS
jgi:uncharacterized protein YrrD